MKLLLCSGEVVLSRVQRKMLNCIATSGMNRSKTNTMLVDAGELQQKDIQNPQCLAFTIWSAESHQL